jgi:TetR/AcrR family transcriptional regulator, transcriptional repressor for nem operon
MALTTRDKLLNEAERLTQTRGFNAFSFKALASALEIKTASVHYHFPTKADLGLALIVRYREGLRAEIKRLAGRSSHDALGRYVDVFVRLQREERLCLCGSMAADLLTLSEEVQGEVKAYFADTEAWLQATLEQGREAGEFAFHGTAKETARVILALLEGALLTARSFGSPKRLREIKRWILNDLLSVENA